ncbi:MAG: hypothetical protein N3B12_09105 [Armatimonadetes bacterium]|nr:hypothetical protein [Armatimonadota bacterium]
MAEDALAGLSEAHRRGIRATLVFVDEALCEIQQWAEGRELCSELYRERNKLSTDQRRLLIGELERMRQVLANLRDELGLEIEVRGAEAAVHSLACSLWPHLAELKGKHLKRYGPASLAAIERLALSVDELIAGVQRMAEIARMG